MAEQPRVRKQIYSRTNANDMELHAINEHKNGNNHVEMISGRTIDKLTDVEPIYNNQNTILMVAFKEHENEQFLLVVHETRIFYFSPLDSNENKQNIRKSAEALISEIIAMFTTRKYRFLWSLYLLSNLLDKTMLVLLVTALFIPNENNIVYWELLRNYWSVFCLLAIEIFLNVLEYNVRVWLLSRLSIYLHLSLYIGYAISFYYEEIWSPFVTILFFIRLFAFTLGTLIDFAIDLEVDFDLTGTKGDEQIHKLVFIDKCIELFKHIATCKIGKVCAVFGDCLACKCCCQEYNQQSEAKIELRDWEYQGSLFVWSCKNVFKHIPHLPTERHDDIELQNENDPIQLRVKSEHNINGNPRKESIKINSECKYGCDICCKNWHRIIFYIMFFVIYTLVALPITIVVFIWVGVLALLRRIALILCFCIFNRNACNDVYQTSICGEMIGEHIY